MKLQFKHQKFQAEAARVICDVFAGQPYLTPSYMIDRGHGVSTLIDEDAYTGFGNARITPELTDARILENIQTIQREHLIEPSKQLDGHYNLTVEMETGVGKTYTYIKTMYELNKRYGWSKFIVVVPSVAIREGVYKSFQITEDHFVEEYGKKIRYFIYNSAQLTEIDRFASDSAINVIIINSQAFNARGKDARRIDMKLDEFRSRKPIDIIAKTNPILIIDEPQSVEGKATVEGLKKFNPLFTLRYSATHKKDRVFNMIYRLDAMEAYNKKLVKKIAVKGISVSGSTATEGYVYLESINLSKGNPKATIEFEVKGKSSIRKMRRIVEHGDNLFDYSDKLEQYKDGYVVLKIDGRDNSIEFTNGKKMVAGDVLGAVNEEQMRRIQIRETILSHLERERQLYSKGIKVLSLFFIDEVAKYKQYDQSGHEQSGEYAKIFEEEYDAITENMRLGFGDGDWFASIKSIAALLMVDQGSQNPGNLDPAEVEFILRCHYTNDFNAREVAGLLYVLGRYYALYGQNEKAKECYRRVLSVRADFDSFLRCLVVKELRKSGMDNDDYIRYSKEDPKFPRFKIPDSVADIFCRQHFRVYTESPSDTMLAKPVAEKPASSTNFGGEITDWSPGLYRVTKVLFRGEVVPASKMDVFWKVPKENDPGNTDWSTYGVAYNGTLPSEISDRRPSGVYALKFGKKEVLSAYATFYGNRLALTVSLKPGAAPPKIAPNPDSNDMRIEMTKVADLP